MTSEESAREWCKQNGYVMMRESDYEQATTKAYFEGQNASTSEKQNKCDAIPGRCKDCTYFEYDKVMMICGIPLIAMHEYCGRWGDGVKSSENGFCFLFEHKDGTVQRG